MKSCRFSIVVIFFFPVLLNAQYNDILVFKNGEELVGEVINNYKYAVYRESKGSKKQKFLKTLLYSCTKEIPIYGEERQTFYYKKVKGARYILLLQKKVDGKTECYHELSYVNTAGGGRLGPVSTYYLGKQTEDHLIKVTHGPRFKKFEKMIYKFFDQCPELVEKYTAGYFEKEIEALIDITKFYNKKCN